MEEILFTLALLADLALGGRLPRTRGLAFLVAYAGFEIAGVVAAVGIALRNLVESDSERAGRRWFRLQVWWASGLLAAARHIFGLRIRVSGDVETQRPLIVLARHASMADTLLPAVHLSAPHGLRLRYVLKRELLWDPCLDLVGHRLPNVFVERDPERSERESERIAALATLLAPGEGVMIYPEGTRFSPARRQQVLARLGASSRLPRAEQLRNVLPPRPRGTLTLLDSLPEADVLVCVHHGLEGARGIGNLFDGALTQRTVEVELWQIPRSQIPAGDEARREWLWQLWERIDAWLEERGDDGR